MIAAEFAYLDARVSFYARQLLGVDQILRLIDHTGDEDTLELSQSNALLQDTDDLDQSNVNILLRELAILVRPLSGAPRELLGYWAHRFELGNLKTIIRGKMANQPRPIIEARLQNMAAFASLPIDELLQSDTPAELLRRLERTPYAEIASRARHLLEQGEALFALDAALDRRYYAGLARLGRATDSGPRKLLRELVGSIVDRGNLVWLLRYRYAYNLSPAQAYYLLIPASTRLFPQHLQQLAQCASFEDAISSLPSPFDKIVAGARDTTEVTLRLEQESWRIANNILRHSNFNVARALAYMMLRERDLRRLRAIARGRSMRMGGSVIRSALGIAESRHEVS
jgi:V/A-type H+/Na+-transporting ATPase subunit C